MISAFGVEHGDITKFLVSDRHIERDLKNREKFVAKHPKGGSGLKIPAKELKRIEFPDNQTRKSHVKELRRDMKQHGQRRAVAVRIDRENPNYTYLANGTHRVHAGSGVFRNQKMRANVRISPKDKSQAFPVWLNHEGGS